MRISKNNLEGHFYQYMGVVIGNMPPFDCYEPLIEFIEKKNFLQILYDYGIVYLHIILEFFKDIEDYDTCKLIKDTIENHNKISGENLDLKLCEKSYS